MSSVKLNQNLSTALLFKLFLTNTFLRMAAVLHYYIMLNFTKNKNQKILKKELFAEC